LSNSFWLFRFEFGIWSISISSRVKASAKNNHLSVSVIGFRLETIKDLIESSFMCVCVCAFQVESEFAKYIIQRGLQEQKTCKNKQNVSSHSYYYYSRKSL
jgi:hypothetical protein